jgi:SPP1 gp7 family putative phage head morphogenesis protein
MTIDDVIRQFQAALLARETATAAELVNSYQRIWRLLSAEQEALFQAIDARRAKGETLSAIDIQRMEQYRVLLADTQREMDRYAVIVADQTYDDMALAAQNGYQQAMALLAAKLPPELAATFNAIPTAAIEALTAALQQGPLANLLAALGAEMAAGVGDALLATLLKGLSPRQAAAQMADAWGMALTRALRIARTEMMRAHRMASLAAYNANKDVVTGWQWMATLDVNTCMSCIALDGSEHGLDEDLDDHPNGRCVPIPITKSWAELGFEGMPDTGLDMEPDRGRQWFEGLSAEQQQAMMGPGMFAAWQAGQFDFAALSKESWDEEWGRMFSEPSLKELVGA